MNTDNRSLLEASDEIIESAVQFADPMVLRGLLFQLEGDPSLEKIATVPRRAGFTEVPDVQRDEDAAMLRAKAAEFLKRYRDAGAPAIALQRDRLHKSLALSAGEPIASDEMSMWLEQAGFDPWARTFKWDVAPEPQQIDGYRVAVIGTGMGGINAAIGLERANIPYFVIEKNEDIGGTWLENQYPGARVDSASRVYSHIFATDYVFKSAFSPQGDNLEYLRWLVDRFDLRAKVTFNTEVTSLKWNDDCSEWEISATGPEGVKTWRANAIISAVGFLSRPNIPEITGIDSFEGDVFHTARWPKNYDHKGKRIALIGTGASGYQLAPELAKSAAKLDIFQRTPSWCFDVPIYLDQMPAEAIWLENNVPFYRNYLRFRISWTTAPHHVAEVMHIDPAFKDQHALSETNKRIRDDRVAFLESKLGHRPDLVQKMTPNSPPLATRYVLVDRSYSIYDILLKDNVELVSDPIISITKKGIKTKDGCEREYDAIVLATGFRANEFLAPMKVTGRAGLNLEELWKEDGARAYLGTMLPSFPNFFMIYGPNSNNWGGLQIIDFQEMAVRFSVGCIAALIEQRRRSVVVSEQGYRRYNEVVDLAEARMLYSDKRASTYYRNSSGRSAANNPIDIRLIWQWMRSPLKHGDGALKCAAYGVPGPVDLIRPFVGGDLALE